MAKDTFDIRIRYIQMMDSKIGAEIELNETINLRRYARYGARIPTKTRRTTWQVSDEVTIREIVSLCTLESLFNQDYGEEAI